MRYCVENPRTGLTRMLSQHYSCFIFPNVTYALLSHFLAMYQEAIEPHKSMVNKSGRGTVSCGPHLLGIDSFRRYFYEVGVQRPRRYSDEARVPPLYR